MFPLCGKAGGAKARRAGGRLGAAGVRGRSGPDLGGGLPAQAGATRAARRRAPRGSDLRELSGGGDVHRRNATMQGLTPI